MEILYKTFDYAVKEADESALTVQHFISTEKRDRIKDKMHADGMIIEGLPVVLLEHGKGFMGTEPIAKPVWIRPGTYKRQKGIEANTQFFDDEQGVGRRLWQKTKERYMPNWSIGYGIKDAAPFKDGGLDITKWYLFEYSLVGVPMHPDANTIKDMPNILVKYLNEPFIKLVESDNKVLRTCSLHDKTIYTENMKDAKEEIDYVLDELESNAKQYYVAGNTLENNVFDDLQKNIGELTTRIEKLETSEESENMDQKNIDEIKEKIDKLESTVNTFVDAVDAKFKEYAGIVKDLKEERRERKIVFKAPEPPPAPKQEDEIRISKKMVDEMMQQITGKYITDLRKMMGKVD